MKRKNPFNTNEEKQKKVPMSIDEKNEPEDVQEIENIEKDPGAPDNEEELVEVVVLCQDELKEPTDIFKWNESISTAQWGEQYAAIEHFRQTLKYHKDFIQSFSELEICLSNLVVPSAMHLRSALSRNSVYCIGELFLNLKESSSIHLPILIPVLLNRSMNEKKFIRDAAHDALAHAVSSCCALDILQNIMPFSSDKNPQIVATAGQAMEQSLLQYRRNTHENQASNLQPYIQNWITDLARFLSCRVVACKGAAKRSIILLRDMLGSDEMSEISKQQLHGSHLVDMLKLIATPSPSKQLKKTNRPALSLRERMMRQTTKETS